MTRKKPSRPASPALCPVCGEDVPPGSLACPECGADDQSGWREDAALYDAVDVPDEDFNYDEFARKEFSSSVKPAGMKPIWWLTAILLLAALVAIYIHAVR